MTPATAASHLSEATGIPASRLEKALEWHPFRSATYAPTDNGCYWVIRREDGLFWYFHHIEKNRLDTPDSPCQTMADGKLWCHKHYESSLKPPEAAPT